MNALFTRRHLLAGLACSLVVLPGCSTLGALNFEGAIRRLLTLSSQRAFARLLEDNGFFADDLARVPLPPELAGGGSVVSALLRTGLVQDQLLRVMNRAAAEGAEQAAPIVYDAIRSMSLRDAVSLVRGGPTAATDFLQQVMGNAIVDAIFPGVGTALRVLDTGVVQQVVRAATGIDFGGLQRHVADSAARGIYRAIGREEAAIRANPRETGDPLLIGVFGVLGR